MKIFLLPALTFIIPMYSFSQIYGSGNVTETIRTFKEVKSLEITGHFVVELIQGDKEEVRIITDDNIHQYVKTENLNGVLKIYLENNKYRKIKSRRLIITVKNLESISNNGSGDISSDGQFSANSLTVNLTGSGDIDLNLSTTNLTINLNGSGDISLLGNSTILNITQFGSGDVRAYNLQAMQVKINATGSGNIQVFANGELSGSTSGNGDVFHKGAASSSIKSSGSGEIIKEY